MALSPRVATLFTTAPLPSQYHSDSDSEVSSPNGEFRAAQQRFDAMSWTTGNETDMEACVMDDDDDDVVVKKSMCFSCCAVLFKMADKVAGVACFVRDNSIFKALIVSVIIMATIFVGLETDRDLSKRFDNELYIANMVIYVIFATEVVIKFIAEGRKPWRYFCCGWNCVDFSIVVAGGLTQVAGSVMVFRLARLIRVLRLLKAVKQLQAIISTVFISMMSIVYILILLGLVTYVYAVVGVWSFRDNDPVHWGNLGVGALSLYRIATLDDWTDLMYTNMWGCRDFYSESLMKYCTNSQGSPYLSVMFFLSFVLVGAMTILNLFVALITNNFDESMKEETIYENDRKKQVWDHLKHVMRRRSSILKLGSQGKGSSMMSVKGSLQPTVGSIRSQKSTPSSIVSARQESVRSVVSMAPKNRRVELEKQLIALQHHLNRRLSECRSAPKGLSVKITLTKIS